MMQRQSARRRDVRGAGRSAFAAKSPDKAEQRILPVFCGLVGKRALFLGLLTAVTMGGAPSAAATSDENLRPGLAWESFDDVDFQRPALSGVDAQINLDTGTRIHDYSKLWLGFLRAPTAGEVTFSAEADDGLRLQLGDALVIDGWGLGKPREGRRPMRTSELAPLKLEFFQYGGGAHLRLYWSWEGHPRELIPASAFWHSAQDAQKVRPLAAVHSVTPRESKAAIYPEAAANRAASGPIHLLPGPHLFLDEFLIESSRGVARKVNCPHRAPTIPNPVVTGKEDGCFQPFLTVLREPAAGKFRLWYNVHTPDFSTGQSHLGYLESDDGIRWLRPHRVLADPSPIQFGVSVLDEGSGFVPPGQRFKCAWYHGDGLKVAVSRDGLAWTSLTPGVVLRHSHDVNSIFWDPLRGRYVAIVGFGMAGPTWSGPRRVAAESVSSNLLTWAQPWLIVTPDDRRDEGQTQFYAMDGFLPRGELIIGLVKVLRDDLKADNPPVPPAAYGLGYTTLAWTRDGEHWTRDQAKFFDRDPQPGAWDHAHAWIDEQVAVGEEVYLYYGGYKSGHKVNRFEERQIGLVKMERDRYVAREAGVEPGRLRTPPLLLHGASLHLNLDARAGEARVQVLDETGRPLPGLAFADCEPVRGNGLALPVRWHGALATAQGQPVRLEFSLRQAQLFAFELSQ